MRNRRFLTLILTGAVATSVPVWAGWDEGVAAFKAKNYAQAAKEFEGVVAERPDWPGGYLMLGRTQLLQRRAGDAVTSLRKGYDLNPNDVQIQLYLAQAYLGAQRANEASQLLGKVNAASLPKEQQSFFGQLQAKALADSGQTERAAAALARAAAASPNDAELQYDYGRMALNAGDMNAAVAALEKASRLDSKDSAKTKLYVQALIRQAREKRGDDAVYARAAEVARTLAARESSFDHLLLLGEAQLGAKQYEAAVTTFDQASKKNESDWLPHFYSGQALTTLSRYSEAEAALKRGLSEASKSDDKARIWRQLGFVYEKKKDFPQAKTAYLNGGDSGGAARVEQNAQIAENNRQAEEERKKLEELRAAQEAIKKQLQNQGAPPPGG